MRAKPLGGKRERDVKSDRNKLERVERMGRGKLKKPSAMAVLELLRRGNRTNSSRKRQTKRENGS